MVTSRDVARLAGVSQSTVSYVMSGQRSISPETRRRVEEAMAALRFRPHAGARALASRRSRVVGLMVPFSPGADTTGVLPFIETIARCARERDHNVLLATEDEGAGALERLAGGALCDALVLMDIEAKDPRTAVAAGLELPVILIGVPEDTGQLTCVDLDFEQAGRLAVDELAACGHRRIVELGYPRALVRRDVNFVRRFGRGALAAARRHGIPYTRVTPEDAGRTAVDAALAEALALADGTDDLGLVVPEGRIVPAVLARLAESGLTPGRDLSVLAVCTDDAAEATHPPVSNISTEPRTVSRTAMDALFRLLEDGPEPARVGLVLPRLTRRHTTVPHPYPLP
ncbi:LacI family DNA-binding transcriptional regulator [Streptomyces endophyticus]|uniref:LacI family transcriptional regulator n=1 Tax=Streptomyces endophyticus TaxID=714166 RepID=A0ABU6EZ69_9ACTN|nr:LacI family DNA-binding transcriptional regulator [Streptomyces endophyticus]MEB8336919.1 LacI family transcriptional regulator [Streptomyces endophyticus]